VNPILLRWNQLKAAQRVALISGVIALSTSFFVLARMATQPSMTLLYAGLEAPQAGEVVRALEQRGEAYEIKGGTIFVPHQRRDELRMTLATESLPANSSSGYELLDSLSGFGTTSQMFDAAYLRAKEGELARTIVSSSQISMARVHIAQIHSNAFNRNKTGTTSVFVTAAGSGIDVAQAKALRYLVASAVAGISPENVSIVDEKGGLINDNDSTTSNTASDSQSIELKSKIMRLLEARVGAENAIVEVSVENVLQSEQITERIFDPAGRVIISTDNEERNDTAEGSGTAGVKVASNLPDREAGAGENSKSNATETRERVNYEVSETQREIIKAPGAIKRLSVAVLVNGVEDADTPGTLIPRGDAELAQFSALVRSAIGFDEARGDVVTVQSMTFTPKIPQGSGPIAAPLFNTTLDAMTLIQMAILALVTIITALFVVRPLLRSSAAPALPKLEAPIGFDQVIDGNGALATKIDASRTFDEPVTGIAQDMLPATLPNLDSSFENSGDSPVQRLREMIENRQDETIDILRQWLEQKEKQSSLAARIFLKIFPKATSSIVRVSNRKMML
jgi:flagellar M-ring protein FliF